MTLATVSRHAIRGVGVGHSNIAIRTYPATAIESGATMSSDKPGKSDKQIPDDRPRDGESKTPPPNPPRTKTGPWVSPKFGSSGSGGAELEPGPERD